MPLGDEVRSEPDSRRAVGRYRVRCGAPFGVGAAIALLAVALLAATGYRDTGLAPGSRFRPSSPDAWLAAAAAALT